jgi:hypothetical protein
MAKNNAAVFLTLLTVFCFAFANIASPAGSLIEVTVRARGANEEEALESAIDEAIRNALGSIFAERTELGEMLEERLIQYSRGTATNYKIIDSSSDGSGVAVTAVVTVDSRKIVENARSLKEGEGGGSLEKWSSPLLEEGVRKISSLFSEMRYENYLKVKLSEKKSDPRKGILNLSVELEFDRELFFKEFAVPVEKTLDEVFKSKGLAPEIEGEFDSPGGRYSATFELLGPNLSTKAWTLPRNFFDAAKRATGFWVASDGKIATHKRLWLHFSLLDSKGREVERVPVHLPVSNVVFFSDISKESTNPWFYLGLSDEKPGSFAVFFAMPFFGVTTRNGYRFLDGSKENFELKLPPAVVEKVSDVRMSLELER